MKQLTQAELRTAGYLFYNAQISDANLVITEDGMLRPYLVLSGNGWSVRYGDKYAIGTIDKNTAEFKAYDKGLELLTKLMSLVETATFNGLIGKYIRVAVLPQVVEVSVIGHIVEDKWFDIQDFFVQDAETKVTANETTPVDEAPDKEPAAEADEAAEFNKP